MDFLKQSTVLCPSRHGLPFVGSADPRAIPDSNSRKSLPGPIIHGTECLPNSCRSSCRCDGRLMTLRLPEGWSERLVRDWLLPLVSTGHSTLPLPSGVTIPAAVRTMFQQTPADRRELIKTGLVISLQEWTYGAHGYGALETLSQIAALIRATGVVPQLAELVRRECALRRDDEKRYDGLVAAVACLT